MFDSSSSDDRKSEGRRSSEDRKPEGRRPADGRRPEGRGSSDRPSGSRSFNPDFKDKSRDSRPFRERSSERSPNERDSRKETTGRREQNEGSFNRRPFNADKRDRPEGSRDRTEGKRERSEGYRERPEGSRGRSEGTRDTGSRSFGKPSFNSDKKFTRKPPGDRPFERKPFKPGTRRKDDDETRNWTSEERLEQPNLRLRKGNTSTEPKNNELIRLNRYIANAGICSRRKADELIEAGVISVNGEAVSELGFKINPMKDVIKYNGETLRREKMVYVLLNKPKDYITTTDDPQERKTVMNLVEKASKERIYPVGRLDRNTTGLLLMTNDGDLAEKLSHPRNNITKIYQVELNKSLSQGDLNKIAFGIELEDGLIKPDAVSYVQGGTKREIGIQIHTGKNRIVRRIFEHLGYEVEKLDRVVYANLTKKDLPRGRWRYLEEKEVIQLKHFIK